MRQPTDPRARRTAGTLLLAGFAALVAGIAFFLAAGGVEADNPVASFERAKSILLIVAVSFTLLGLLAFDSVLWKGGNRLLSGLGTAAYAIAAVSWVVAEWRILAHHTWTAGLEVAFIVAAGGSMLAFGAAVVRTRAIARWVGWLAIAWSAGWLILFAMPHEGYPPMAPQLVPLLFGVGLLRASGRTGFKAPTDRA